ncbi:MAG TPA: diguanylate cyclase [Gemmatimonadales bacterium]|nr:diguanylate cyclase [Gemmatimonadales bacterium]
MSTWEQTVSKPLRALGLESIRNKLLAFAVLATVIPSWSTAWISYAHNKRSLTEKITGEQLSASSQTARELDLWLKERLYDLRVFASSYEVTENLERMPGARGALAREGQPHRRVNDFLNSVRERFVDYEALIVVDEQGRAVATGAATARAVPLPPDWRTALRTEHAVVGAPYRDDDAQRQPVMTVAVPIYAAGGRLIGALTAKLNLRTVQQVLKRFSTGASGGLYVMTTDGTLIARSRSGPAEPMTTQLAPEVARTLLAGAGSARQYRGFDGEEVIGTLATVPGLEWAIVIEIPAADAFRQVTRLRNVTIAIVTALLLGIGLLAYLLGVLIVRPLDRLTAGAAKVAAGDLAVDLPVVSGGEVGSLTEVFNDMVARLRSGREELQRLSLTDDLTGLYNRRYLMETLATEVRRSRRLQHSFAILIADIDHFKEYNDTVGHLAGDEMLRRVARILRESTREVDCVARYGGEEFVVMLPETGADEAAETAERIRDRVAREALAGGTITLSVGVAEFPTHGDTPESVISSADSALYQAKREGRNRMVRAGAPARRPEMTG